MLEAIVAALATIFGAFLLGRHYTQKKAQADRLERNAKAHERAKDVNNEVDGLSDSDVDKRLRDRAGR